MSLARKVLTNNTKINLISQGEMQFGQPIAYTTMVFKYDKRIHRILFVYWLAFKHSKHIKIKICMSNRKNSVDLAHRQLHDK